MREVGVTRTAKLVAMAFRRDFVGAAHHPGIFRGAILAQLLQQLVQPGIELALGAVAMEMQRQIAGRRHNPFYARRTARASVARVTGKREGVLTDALSTN